MGFIKGSEILVEKYAPLRDPIELVIKGYHVSLRVEEAALVMMEKRELDAK
jgi:Fe2+ transport system protein FeoA